MTVHTTTCTKDATLSSPEALSCLRKQDPAPSKQSAASRQDLGITVPSMHTYYMLLSAGWLKPYQILCFEWFWENLRNSEKAWEMLKICEKSWELLRKFDLITFSESVETILFDKFCETKWEQLRNMRIVLKIMRCFPKFEKCLI